MRKELTQFGYSYRKSFKNLKYQIISLITVIPSANLAILLAICGNECQAFSCSDQNKLKLFKLVSIHNTKHNPRLLELVTIVAGNPVRLVSGCLLSLVGVLYNSMNLYELVKWC